MLEITNAIQSRYYLKFKYKDELTYRYADVYALGINSTGEALIRCYEKNKGWKLFKVGLMNDITVTSVKCIGIKTGYEILDKALKKIIKQVK